MAFVAECKKKNSVQLCVYSEKKDKQGGHFGSSVISVEEMVCLLIIIDECFHQLSNNK
jgi:hypothetical protein